jgi:uncharacterized protein YjbI with pentapeptide repeats
MPERETRLGIRQVDVYTGLNILILLLELHRYAQSKSKWKDLINFYPSGMPLFIGRTTRLLKVIHYSESIEIDIFIQNLRLFLIGTNLSDISLCGTNLTDTNLIDTDLSATDLSSAILIDANLRYVDISNADLSNANLSGADLSNANLSGADLSNTNLCGADLSNADLSDADLSGANLSGANLQGLYLKGADISNANFSHAKWDAWIYGDAIRGLETAICFPHNRLGQC